MRFSVLRTCFPLPSSFLFWFLYSKWYSLPTPGFASPSRHCPDIFSHYKPALLPHDYCRGLWLPGMVTPTLLLQTSEQIEWRVPTISKDENRDFDLRAVLSSNTFSKPGHWVADLGSYWDQFPPVALLPARSVLRAQGASNHGILFTKTQLESLSKKSGSFTCQ